MKVITKGILYIFIGLLLSFCKDDEVYKLEKEEVSVVKIDSIKVDSISEDTSKIDTASVPIVEKPEALPVDTASLPQEEQFEEGIQLAENLNKEVNTFGHYIYLPKGYNNSSDTYPLIIFLHGVGERGNSQHAPSELKRVLRTGLPALIQKGKWKPENPAIVVSPQCHGGGWEPKDVHKFINHIATKYKVNRDRIYMTGVSMGGIGLFEYIGTYGDSSYIAAAVPIAAGGNTKKADSFHNIPIWAFHGSGDKVISVNRSKAMVKAIKEKNPVSAPKLTIYPNVGHVSWDMTYDESGMGKESKQYDPFSEDVFTWMYKFTKRP